MKPQISGPEKNKSWDIGWAILVQKGHGQFQLNFFLYVKNLSHIWICFDEDKVNVIYCEMIVG